MSKYKARIESTPPLSYVKRIEAKGRQSKPLAKTGRTQTYMQTTRKPSLSTSKTDNSLTTPLTTPKITDKIRQHSVLLKVIMKVLETAGLIERFEVLSKEQEVIRVRYEFDMRFWSKDLDLK